MADLKPCPFMIAAQNTRNAPCIGTSCAWWCDLTECCCVPLMAGILADLWNIRDGERKDGVEL